MAKFLTFLALHVVLLVLASTCFTVVTGLSDGRFQWEYFRYNAQNGWGVPYEFPYSLPVVMAYFAAYAIGVTAYGIAYSDGLRTIGVAGVMLCAVGFASFALDISHWVVDHNRSWIASAPILLLLLAPAAAIQRYRQHAF